MADALPTVSYFKVLAVLLFLLNTQRTRAFQNIEDRVIETTNLTSFTKSPLQEANDGKYVSFVPTKKNISEIIFITYNRWMDDFRQNDRVQFAVNETKLFYADAVRNFRTPEIYSVLIIEVVYEGTHEDIFSFLTAANSVVDNGINSYGVSINIDDCLKPVTTVNGMENIWDSLHFILLNVKIEEEILRCGVDAAIGCVEGKMRKCHRILSKLPVEKIFYEISGHYDSSKNLHTETFSLREWKMPENVEILIREFGDKVTSRKIEKDRKNWIQLGTKLRTNLPYYIHTAHRLYWPEENSTSEGGDDEYPLNSTCPQSPTPSQNASTASLAKKSQTTGKNTSFHGSHFGVGFNPRFMKFTGYSELDGYDLYPFLELILTKFRNIFTSFPSLNGHNSKYNMWHLENLLVAVASFNRDKSTASNQNETARMPALQVLIEIEIHYSLYSLIETHNADVETIKKFVASANKVFNGTIPYILLKGTDNTEAYTTDLIMSQIIFIKQRANNVVRMGATFDLRDCDTAVPVLQILPFVVFRKVPNENDVERGAAAFLQNLKHDFIKCLQSKQTAAPNCGVGLQTRWPDTDINGKKNLTALTWLWTSLNDFALNQNVTVFFESAFDEPASNYNQHTGWWELKDPPPCYGGSNEFQFLEKHLNPIKYIGTPNFIEDEVTNMITFGKKRIHLNLVQEELENNLPGQVSLFHRERFGVQLSFSSLFKDYGASDISNKDVRSIIGLVHTRFSRVLIDLVDADSVISQEPHLRIPEQAAWLNKKNEKKFQLEPDKLIQIFIHFEIYDLLQGDIQKVPESIHVAKNLADKANNIFSQTVPYFLMDVSRTLWSVNSTEFKMAVKKATSLLKPEKQLLQEKNETQSYQLGVVFAEAFCSQTTEHVNWLDLTTCIFPHIHVAFIRVGIIERELFKDKSTQFENCAARIKNRFPNMTVGVTFYLLNFNSNNSNAMVDFWQHVNEYSKIKSIPVFLGEVFDKQYYKNGWWKITIDGDEEYIEEKYERKETPAERQDVNKLKIVISCVFAGCVVIVVISYAIYKIYDIKYRRDAYAALSGLTEVEILQFFAGRNQDDCADAETEFRNEETDRFKMTHYFSDCAYDQSLELDTDAFTLDDSLNLGSGAYGQVCVGRVLLNGSEVRAAVKRAKSVGVGEEGLTGLRSLLSEIKVLSYLGRQNNIVALLGAHTGNISKGEVLVFLELCSRGSLHKCLSILRNSEHDSTNDLYTYLDESSATHDKNLLAMWSLEIAKGMEFLASKHVVHADLATRNVLLDTSNKAKICDFGLSRRMMNYESYVKTHQEPLPWRWMSPESLRFSLFNEKSDVWSFGVTMWEIFTLGNQPFAGLSWTVDFATSLEEDLRLPVPKRKSGPLFEDKNMYPIMQRCWQTDPKERPTFQELVRILSEE